MNVFAGGATNSSERDSFFHAKILRGRDSRSQIALKRRAAASSVMNARPRKYYRHSYFDRQTNC